MLAFCFPSISIAEGVEFHYLNRSTALLRQPRGTLPLYLQDNEARDIARHLQESRRLESMDDGNAGVIQDWLERPIISGDLGEDTGPDGQPRYRSETCLKEIWSECFGNDTKSYTQQSAQSLGRAMALIPGWSLCTIGTGRKRFGTHGRQRFYSLDGDAGYIARNGNMVP